jgi:hypothetical protein
MRTRNSTNSKNRKVLVEGEAEFNRLRAQRDALRVDELMKPNLDVARAVGVVLASEPRIAAMKADFSVLRNFDASIVDQLRPIALALGYANVRFAPPPEEAAIKEMVAGGAMLRGTLMRQAKALVELGRLVGVEVDAIRIVRTNRGLAANLTALASLFQEHWEDVEEVTSVTEEQVRHAGQLGMRILEGLGSKDVSPSADSKAARAADNRMRAYTLLAKTYDQVRRAVIYLRWNEGDAESIAPSFHIRDRRRAAISGPASAAPIAAAPSPPPATAIT